MGKLSKKDKEKRSKRLILLIDRLGITKREFATEIGRSSVLISNMTSVRNPATITDKTIELINEHYPDYSVEWLKGDAEFPNQREQNLAVIERTQIEADLLAIAFDALCKLNGYTYTATAPATANSDGRYEVTEVVKAVREGFIVSDGKKRGHLTFDELHGLKNEINDFAAFKLGRVVDGKETERR